MNVSDTCEMHVLLRTCVPSLPVFGCLVGSPVVCPPSSLAAAVSELTTDVWFWSVATDLSALPHFHARTNCSVSGLSNCARSAQMPQFACLPFPSADGAVLAVLVTQ